MRWGPGKGSTSVSIATAPADVGWSVEISLDLQMVSAICPKCNILLVEATSSYLNDLGTAVNEAVTLGAVAVSNSYGSTGVTVSAKITGK